MFAFRNIPGMGQRGLHSDIVVEVNGADDFVIAIGSNIGGGQSGPDSVRRRRYPLDANRRLIVQRRTLYTTEDASLNLPPFPGPGNAALDSFSTRRIFAL